jgi:hypothetical protein
MLLGPFSAINDFFRLGVSTYAFAEKNHFCLEKSSQKPFARTASHLPSTRYASGRQASTLMNP